MDNHFFNNKTFNVNPSLIYRIFLIILFLGEIFIFFNFYLSQNFTWATWKNYLFIAVFFPIILIFITGVIVESFQILFYNKENHDETGQRSENQGHVFLSFRKLFSKIPFLLKLLLLIIAIIICYYLKNIALITTTSVDTLILIFFAGLLVFVFMVFVYFAVCMIFNYKKNVKELELYFLTEQKLLKQNICPPLQDADVPQKIDNNNESGLS